LLIYISEPSMLVKEDQADQLVFSKE
jgi:hypothetical protein